MEPASPRGSRALSDRSPAGALGVLPWRRRREPVRVGPPAGAFSAHLTDGRALILGDQLAGEHPLPVWGRSVLLPVGWLTGHLLVCGATGSGKTETALRLAYLLARETNAQVFYLDGKGDRHAAARFIALMADAGRDARVFPNEPFDGWRGTSAQVLGRLMEVIDYPTDGPASWYRDIARAALALACEHPDGPPRSSQQLLARLEPRSLQAAHPTGARVFTDQQLSQVRLRYQSFFATTAGRLDGGWAWQDTSCAYLLLDSLALRDQARGLSRFLLDDFAAYFTLRKPRGRLCVMFVDEFSALAEHDGMASRVEQARGYRTAFVLIPQSAAGMGSPTQTQRLLASIQTVICHRINSPEAIITLAGTQLAQEYSTHLHDGTSTGAGSARLQHQFKIDPNQVRSLPTGQAFLITRGEALRLRIHQPPQVRPARLPTPAAGAAPPTRPRAERDIPY